MAVDIGPRIGIDGEKQFRQELTNINQQIRTLGSEMKAVTSAFDGNERSEEALAAQTGVLNRQLDAQRQKLQQLQRGLDAATDKFGEADTRTLRWAQAVQDATADLNRMENQLDDLDSQMNGGFFTKLKSQIVDLAGEDSFVGRLASGGGLGGLLTKGFAVGAVVGGVQQLTGAMFDLVESTQQYRSIMASLETSSAAAGYTTEQTTQTYQRLQSVLGDTQSAATATANLQAIGLSQTELQTITDASIGAWARYGDSIPIDSLAEAINETIQAGTVTGTFADVLNWAGTNEDEFNAKLQAANSTSERANIVMQELARQGLAESGQAWIENNQDIVQMNASTDKMDAAMARLGERLAPLAAGLKNLGADAINFLVDQIDNAASIIGDLPSKAMTWGKDLIESFVSGIKKKLSSVTNIVKDIAEAVADFIGFSEPEKGPLSNFHTFAPDMMDLYSSGIRQNAYKVTRAMDNVSRQIADSVDTPDFAPSGSSTGVRRYSGGDDASALAAAVRAALDGAAVYMSGRKVGQLITRQQNNTIRANGLVPTM